MNINDKELNEWVSNNMTPESDMGKAFLRMMELDKVKEVEVDHSKMVDYLKSIDEIKKYFNNNCDNCKIESKMFDVTNKNCRVEISFDSVHFDNYYELYPLISDASWICLGVTGDDMVKMTIEFWDVAKEKGGSCK